MHGTPECGVLFVREWADNGRSAQRWVFRLLSTNYYVTISRKQSTYWFFETVFSLVFVVVCPKKGICVYDQLSYYTSQLLHSWLIFHRINKTAVSSTKFGLQRRCLFPSVWLTEREERSDLVQSLNSLAILDAMFLKPMEVPDILLKRTPFKDSLGSLHTSISHVILLSSESLPSALHPPA